MKIYDISQELLACRVYPGDPHPKREEILSTQSGAPCNLSTLFLCAHNGTHVDAPYHFLSEGSTVEQLSIEQTVGWAYVAECSGVLDAASALEICNAAAEKHPDAAKRILLKGDILLTADAARAFVAHGVGLIGVESQSVGDEKAPREVHLILLGAGVIPLEGIRLGEVASGTYLLCAAPIAVKGGDGSPCRAVLVEL